MSSIIKVYIVDDQKLFIDGLMALLNTDDEIEVAGYSLDGESALGWLKDNTADILLLDMRLFMEGQSTNHLNSFSRLPFEVKHWKIFKLKKCLPKSSYDIDSIRYFINLASVNKQTRDNMADFLHGEIESIVEQYYDPKNTDSKVLEKLLTCRDSTVTSELLQNLLIYGRLNALKEVSNEDLITFCDSLDKCMDMLSTISEELKNNYEFSIELIKLSWNYTLNDEPKNHFIEIVKITVKKDGLALRYAPDDLKDNYDIVKKAVKQNGLALQYASQNLRKSSTIVNIAVNQNNLAIEFITSIGLRTKYFLKNKRLDSMCHRHYTDKTELCHLKFDDPDAIIHQNVKPSGKKISW